MKNEELNLEEIEDPRTLVLKDIPVPTQKAYSGKLCVYAVVLRQDVVILPQTKRNELLFHVSTSVVCLQQGSS